VTATWEELQLGVAPPVREYGPITRTDIVRYVGTAGDMNPIHHDELYAREAGFPTVFSAGMLQAGMLASFATDWLGAPNVRRYAVQLREQVWPGDVIACSAEVVGRHEADGERRVDVSLTARRVASGGTAVLAEATFVVP
jgi:acyl dehydratase